MRGQRATSKSLSQRLYYGKSASSSTVRESKTNGLVEDEITQFIELLLRRAVLVGIGGQLKVCRDDRDNMFLETAITAGAGYLISRDDDLKGDGDLIEQMRAHGVEVMTVSHFLQGLAAGGA